MRQTRYVVWVPVITTVVTVGLWFWARLKYLALVCPPDGTCSPLGWEIGWSDYAPFPLQIAGALNAPIATFAYPLYYLVQDESRPWNLLLFAAAAALQWTYIGMVLDNRVHFLTSVRLIRIPLGALVVLFGLFTFVFTIPLHHVSGFYKVAAFGWAILICKHSLWFFRTHTVRTNP